MDGGAWWAAVHRVPQSQTRLKWHCMHACIGEGNGNPLQCSHPWRIPGMEEPGGLPSMGLHRVRRDWSDLAAATAYFLFIKKKFFSSAAYFLKQKKKIWKSQKRDNRERERERDRLYWHWYNPPSLFGFSLFYILCICVCMYMYILNSVQLSHLCRFKDPPPQSIYSTVPTTQRCSLL